MFHPEKSAKSTRIEKEKQYEVREYKRTNGTARITVGEKIFVKSRTSRKEDVPYLRPITKIEYLFSDGTSLDFLNEFPLPSGWHIMETNAIRKPAEAYSDRKLILISSTLSNIVDKKIVGNKQEAERHATQLERAGMDKIHVSYSPKSSTALFYTSTRYFETPSAFFMLLHEFSHARTNYNQETNKRYAEIMRKKRKDMNEKDIEDYQKLVVEDEFQRNREAIEQLMALRSRGIDLEPDIEHKNDLENLGYKELWAYEQKLYPNMAKLTSLVQQFADLVVSVLRVREEEILSPKIYRYLKKHGLDVPTFGFLYGRKAKEWLKQHNLVQEIQSAPDAILVMNMPKPLAYWWWKGSETGFEKWGKILYEEKMPLFWHLRDFIEGLANHMPKLDQEQQTKLEYLSRVSQEFDDGLGVRIDQVGEHGPETYYYVWGWWLIDQQEYGVVPY